MITTMTLPVAMAAIVEETPMENHFVLSDGRTPNDVRYIRERGLFILRDFW